MNGKNKNGQQTDRYIKIKLSQGNKILILERIKISVLKEEYHFMQENSEWNKRTLKRDTKER